MSCDDPKIEAYFDAYLPGFLGRQLIPNLVSLSVVFWIGVADRNWTLEIREGMLRRIAAQEMRGDFGYRVSPETFLEVVRARMSPQQSFFLGRTRIDGDVMQALKTATALEEFFRRFSYPH